MAIKQKQIFFTVENQKYSINFPNVGQLIDIENMKLALTNGQYAEMIKSGLKIHYYNVDVVDMISIFYVLVPQLKNDLSVKSFSELDSFLAKKLLSSYRKEVKEWYEGMMDDLMKEDEIEQPLKPSTPENQPAQEGDIDLN